MYKFGLPHLLNFFSISADIIYTDLRIRTFQPVSVSAFLSGFIADEAWISQQNKIFGNREEKLEEYITELHKNTNTNRTDIKKVDISLAIEEATEKNTFMRTDFLSDASN